MTGALNTSTAAAIRVFRSGIAFSIVENVKTKT